MATYQKGSSSDTWTFSGNMAVGGTIGSTGVSTQSAGLILNGTPTTTVSIVPTATTTAVSIGLTGKTYATGVALGVTGGTLTAGIATGGTVTTGISLAAASTTAIDMSGAITTGMNIAGSAMTTGISIGLTGKTYATGIACGVTGGTLTTGLSMVGTFVTAMALGSSGTPLPCAAYTDSALKIYTTNASTHGSNSVEPVYISTLMTGAAGVGGRARINMTIDDGIALGAWANAFKASVDCGTTGYASGLLSVACFEIDMPSAGAGGGTTAILETELTSGSGWTGGSPVSILYFNNTGDGKAAFDTNGYLLDLNGLTQNTDKIFRVTAPGAAAASLRIRIDGVPYYISLSAAQA